MGIIFDRKYKKNEEIIEFYKNKIENGKDVENSKKALNTFNQIKKELDQKAIKNYLNKNRNKKIKTGVSIGVASALILTSAGVLNKNNQSKKPNDFEEITKPTEITENIDYVKEDINKRDFIFSGTTPNGIKYKGLYKKYKNPTKEEITNILNSKNNYINSLNNSELSNENKVKILNNKFLSGFIADKNSPNKILNCETDEKGTFEKNCVYINVGKFAFKDKKTNELITSIFADNVFEASEILESNGYDLSNAVSYSLYCKAENVDDYLKETNYRSVNANDKNSEGFYYGAKNATGWVCNENACNKKIDVNFTEVYSGVENNINKIYENYENSSNFNM